MHDSPLQTVLQQRDAKPVSGEHLEVLGKHAATQWTTGKCASIHEAVVETVRHEQLSPQQVCRVVEFANQDAYLQEFRKEGSTKVVHFDCGPAVPGQVLQDLNDGGGGSVYDRGTMDYSMHPSSVKHAAAVSMDKTAAATPPAVPGLTKLPNLPSLPKAASSQYEEHLWDLFTGGTKSAMAYAEPLQPLVDARHKLAGARDALTADINSLELDYAEVGDQLYRQVKQASFEGTSLSDVVAAWSAVTMDPVYTKLAFAAITPRLQREGVFANLDDVDASLTKRASAHAVNLEHPLVALYADFVTTLDKLATARAALAEVEQGGEQVEALLKQGSGLVGAAKKGLGAASKVIDTAAKPVAHILVGAKGAKDLAPVLAGGTKLTALGVGALAANAGLQSVTDRPGTQRVLRVAKSITPGTPEYQERRYRHMSGM